MHKIDFKLRFSLFRDFTFNVLLVYMLNYLFVSFQVSEGIDFSDDSARVVVSFIPF